MSQVTRPPLTIIAVRQDGDLGRWEVGAHLATHGHAEADIEALFLLIQRVIDDNDATELLTFVLLEPQDAGVVLGPADVIRVGQDGVGCGSSGRVWGPREKMQVETKPFLKRFYYNNREKEFNL